MSAEVIKFNLSVRRKWRSTEDLMQEVRERQMRSWRDVANEREISAKAKRDLVGTLASEGRPDGE